MFPPEILETPRLRLRPPTLDDAVRIYHAYGTDPEVCRYMLWRPHTSVGETRDFLARMITNRRLGEGHQTWALELDGALVGMIGATIRDHAVEVGYVLARSAWGRGLVPEALTALCDAAFTDPAIDRVWASCHVENPQSARVMEKVGMRFEGVLRSYLRFPNLGPEPQDCRIYARVRRDLA